MLDVVKSVSKHTVIYGIGDMLSKGIALIMIPFYTHYLSTEEYGTIEILDTTTYIVGLLLGMGITQSVVRLYFEYEDKESKDKVVSIAVLVLLAVAVLIMPILSLLSGDIAELVLDARGLSHYFIIVFASMMIALINDVPRSLIRIQQRSTLYITISACQLVIKLSLNILFIAHYKMGVLGVLIAGLVTVIATALFLSIYLVMQVRISWSTKIFKGMVSYSFPLVWTWFGAFMLHFGDRFLLQKLDGLDSVGIYSLAYKFGMIANMLIMTPFMMTWTPKQFEIADRPDAQDTYARVFTYFLAVFVYVSLGISVLIKDVIVIIADPRYHSAHNYVPYLAASYVFYASYSFVQLGILLKKKTKYLGVVVFVIGVFNIALNFFLVPRYGVWGAVIATAVSMPTLFGFIFMVSQRMYYIPYQIGRILKLALVAAVVFVVTRFTETGSTWLDLTVDFAIAASFPFFLCLIGFYEKSEIQKLKEGSSAVRRSMARRWRSR